MSWAEPVEADTQMPTHADVVVVGGGITGVSTALELARRGMDCVLVEKGAIAAEQSSRAFGWICSLGTDPSKLELAALSKQMWSHWADSLGAEELGYNRSGLVFACDTETDLRQEAQWLVGANGHVGVDARIVGGDRMSALLPGLRRRVSGGLYQPSDAWVDPRKATSALARWARRLGVRMLAPCAARGIQVEGGQITAVVTERGTVRTPSVVVAGGMWSRLFLGNAGVDLPQLPIHSTLQRLAPVSARSLPCVAFAEYAFRCDTDGGLVVGTPHGHTAYIVPDSLRLGWKYLPALISQRGILKLGLNSAFMDGWRTPRRWALDSISPFERLRVLDPQPNRAANRTARESLQRDFPMLGPLRAVHEWAGVIDATPDSTPVISGIEGVQGLYVNTGFSAFGLTLGPGAGRLTADLITGETACVDPAPYRHRRFYDGTRLRVAP